MELIKSQITEIHTESGCAPMLDKRNLIRVRVSAVNLNVGVVVQSCFGSW